MTVDIKTRRYTGTPFPDSRYLPGTGMTRPCIPHSSAPAVTFDAARWPFSQRYLYAIDLFNYRYWWEAHEVLEEVWIESGKKTANGKFIQGIIQIAAALLKTSQSHSGARRLAAKGLAKIRLQAGVFLGVDVHEFGQQVEAYIRKESLAPPEIELKITA